jgi:hypothetical protein
MAQSMADFSPPVRIGTFASDNKMTALDVKNRHYYIKERLKSVGIEINASGSDGDTREMIFMLQNSGLGVQLSDFTKDTDDYRFFALFGCLISISKMCPIFLLNSETNFSRLTSSLLAIT